MLNHSLREFGNGGYSKVGQLMKLARKIILHSPVSDEALLNDFVEQCLRDEVSIIAIVGPGCSRLEDIIDDLVVGDGSDASRFLCTTSHPDGTLEDVLNMVKFWEPERDDPVQEVRL
jgi:hypothetical protein